MATDRKGVILDAFRNLVRRFGVDKTTMQDVAREAGISVGVIYKDFINKDDLVEAYIHKLVDQIINECQRLAEQPKPPRELLHDVLIGFCSLLGEHVSQDRGFFQCIFGNVQVGQFRQQTMKYEGAFGPRLKTIIVNILRQGQAAGAFELDDIEEDAVCLLNSFAFFVFDLVLNAQKPEIILPKAERMFCFVIKAIDKGKNS
ncbi:MAG TPA: TetR/AcrR family transcriptional regulator [Bacillota bacterium]